MAALMGSFNMVQITRFTRKLRRRIAFLSRAHA